MTERQFAPGEIIYREGDKSDFAYFVKAGRVEILKTELGEQRQVTILGPGDIFGEMGVILDQRRSVTARALDEVEVRAISRSGFLHAANQQPDTARSVLKALLAQLHQEDRPSARIMALPVRAKDEGHDLAKGPEESRARNRGQARRRNSAGSGGSKGVQQLIKIRLLPASETVERLIDPHGITIDELPYRIGRKPGKNEAASGEENELSIRDSKPFNLSRRHFAIEQTRRGLIVRDCGSEAGTMVNGVRIGGQAGINIAILKSGDNMIVAGADNSPYRFTVQVAES